MARHVLIVLAAAALLSGCGYTLSRTGSATGPSAGKYTVIVPVFVNDTFEPLVEKELTSSLKDEIAMDGRWVLTDRDDADLAVTGRVTMFELVPLTYDPEERVQEYRVRISTEVMLSETATGNVLWKDPSMTASAEYRVTQDITKNKIGRNEAIRRASKDFAEEFIIMVLDTF